MVFSKKGENKIEADVDPKLLENIACLRTAQELKEKIISQKETETLNKQNKLLLITEKGFIDDNLSQKEIVESVDVSTATKKMDIKLKYGPYNMDFTRDGRYLCVGGTKGQLAMLDWKTKDLKFDINVQEKIRAVKYLHKETKIAVSQLDYTYIYDNEGREVHCIRQIFRAKYLEYLPYHFLMVAGTEKGFLHYLDVSTGSMVADIKTNHGAVNMMCQNKSNAIIYTGHNTGTVCMWSPNEQSPVMKMMCHETPLRNITVDNVGNYLVTSGQDRRMKVWDLRMSNEELSDLRLEDSPSCLQFSDQGLLAVAMGSNVHILNDVHNGCRPSETDQKGTQSLAEMLSKSNRKVQPARNVRPLLSHSFYGSTVHQIQFCPFEDILGCGLSTGFSTMFVPGSGEPNFDAFECNPYADVNFKKEHEVKQLLQKVPSDLISLTTNVTSVHTKSIKEQWEADKSRLFDVAPVVAVKKKRSKKSRPKPATMKKITTKDNVNYERKRLLKDFYKEEGTNYRVKQPLSKEPINSVLDNLIYRK